MSCNYCPDDICDQIVPVTQNNNTYSIDSAAITPTLVQDSGTQVTLTLTSDVEDFQNINCFFVDSPVAPGVKTISPPETPGWVEKTLTTNSSGVATLVVSNLLATDTWYLVIQGINGVLVISDAITIGV